jgi:hypothetical protein
MTPPEFSVLLLAWDDADPSVAVLGGAALPPTRHLVYQLAAQQPVLAVYPHLPAPEEAAATPPGEVVADEPALAPPLAPPASLAEIEHSEEAVAITFAPEAKDALDTEVAMPGVQLLPSPPAAEPGKGLGIAEALFSRIIGLEDLVRPGRVLPMPETTPANGAAATTVTAAPLMVPTRSQWPVGMRWPGKAWQAPAAPYLGAGPVESFPPPPPAPPRLKRAPQSRQVAVAPRQFAPRPISQPVLVEADSEEVAIVPRAASAPALLLQPEEYQLADDLSVDPDPEQPAIIQPPAFEETTEEMGTAEAYDLFAPEDDITSDEPTAQAETVEEVAVVPAEPAAAPIEEPAAPVVLMPALDGLNFRMIQYARQAARLVQGRTDFTIIYAPNWPAWLAALELRNSTGKPLVLYVASLAADFAAPAERGWLLEIERMTLRRATLILVPDSAAEKRLRLHYTDTIEASRIAVAADEDAVQQHLGELANQY